MSWIAREHDPDWPFDYVASEFVLAPESTALFVIDLQQGDMVKDTDYFGGNYPALVDYWNSRIAELVMPTTKRLIEAFRRQGFAVRSADKGTGVHILCTGLVENMFPSQQGNDRCTVVLLDNDCPCHGGPVA